MKNNDYKYEFELILHAGNAKSKAHFAIEAARNRKFDKAKSFLEQANADLLEAHKIEKCLVVKEAKGDEIEIGILMIHAQDHLTGATLLIEEAEEWIHVYEEIEFMKKGVKV